MIYVIYYATFLHEEDFSINPIHHILMQIILGYNVRFILPAKAKVKLEDVALVKASSSVSFTTYIFLK